MTSAAATARLGASPRPRTTSPSIAAQRHRAPSGRMENRMPGGFEDMMSLATYAGEGNGDDSRRVPVVVSFHIAIKLFDFIRLGRILDIGTLGLEGRFSNLN
jgi:hypothetical protein